MTVVSIRRSVGRARRSRQRLEIKVAEQVEKTEESVRQATIATNRYERAAVELIRDRERLAKAGL